MLYLGNQYPLTSISNNVLMDLSAIVLSYFGVGWISSLPEKLILGLEVA